MKHEVSLTGARAPLWREGRGEVKSLSAESRERCAVHCEADRQGVGLSKGERNVETASAPIKLHTEQSRERGTNKSGGTGADKTAPAGTPDGTGGRLLAQGSFCDRASIRERFSSVGTQVRTNSKGGVLRHPPMGDL